MKALTTPKSLSIILLSAKMSRIAAATGLVKAL